MRLVPPFCRPRHVLVIAVIGSVVAACSAFDRKNIAETPFDAASIKVSLISVAPWEDIYTKLRPNFKLTGDGALAKVLPQTAAFNRRQLDAFAAGLSIGSTDANVDAVALVEDDGGDPEEEGTGTATLPVVPDALSLSGSLSKEPILEYKAAATLFQEVQLLNEYLNHAVIPEGYQPYLVRLQLAVLPLRRDQPFDIFTDLNFLSDNSYGADFPKVVPLLATDSLESAEENDLAQLARNISLAANGTSGGTPFAADLQRLTNRIEEQQTVDLNSLLTISQVTDNSVRIRLGARYDNANRYEMTARTHNITLLVNVPRLRSDDSGFRYTKDRTITTGQDNITLIASSSMRDARTGKRLEEKKSTSKELKRRIEEISKEYPIRDKLDPERWTDGKYCVGEKSLTGERYILNSTEEVIKKLLYRYVFYNEYSSYAYALYCMTYYEELSVSGEIGLHTSEQIELDEDDLKSISLRDEQALWSELSSLAGSIPRDYIKIDLPKDDENYLNNPIGNIFITADETNLSRTAQCCVDDANLGNCYRKDGIRFVNGVMTDDEKTTKVRLPIARSVNALRLQLSLQLGDHEFASEKVTVDANNVLLAQFPSLKSFRAFHPGGLKPHKALLKAVIKPNPWDVTPRPGGSCRTAYIDVHLVGTKPAETPPIVKIAHAAETIAVKQGFATVTLVLNMQQAGTKADVAIKIDKATVKTHPASSSVNSLGEVVVQAPGRFALELQNVDPSRNLEISVGKIDPKTMNLKDGNPAKISIPTRSAAPQG